MKDLHRLGRIGINDLTQKYQTFDNDPLAVLDRDGVGKLVKMAVEPVRKTDQTLEIGRGEPSSVQFCCRVGACR
jgi:hypothetical protein